MSEKEKIMDLLKKSAMEYNKLLSTSYYFEIARKNTKKEFLLSFQPDDFHHIIGLHNLERNNKISRIEADYLLENAHNMNVVYIFLSERSKLDKAEIPVMCCRSFFQWIS